MSIVKQLIFIHIPKTAGTSIRVLASSTFGKDYTRCPHVKKNTKIVLNEQAVFTDLRHISAGVLLSEGIISREWWNNAVKLAVVRNPWDRLVSMYHSMKKQGRYKKYPIFDCFSTFATEISSSSRWIKPVCGYSTNKLSHANPQVEWLKWGVDVVLRFESLESDWSSLCERVGIHCKALPHLEKSDRKKYQDYYDDDLAERVGRFYQEDASRFSYTFDQEEQ